MSIIARQECQACGHVLRDVDHGTCPFRVPSADPPHEFVEVEYVRAADYEGAVEALKRAHAALDVEHGHTAETWDDRQRWTNPYTAGRQ